MSAARTCLGIYRELAHSPGRVDADRAIMESVGTAMAARGFSVDFIAPDAEFKSDFINLFVMCERGPILDRLSDARKTGSIVVNSPDSIRCTYRHRMVERLARHHVFAPASRIVASDSNQPRPPRPVWVKRYDFHATEARDVMYAGSEAEWRVALHEFAKREIPYVIVQEHVPGDLVKFYGVRSATTPVDANWFQSFCDRDKSALVCSFEVSSLRRAAFAAADALGLEIFGGDAIIQADGEPAIIDVNAWPSYARCCDRAAQAIADLLTERFQRRPRSVTAMRC